MSPDRSIRSGARLREALRWRLWYLRTPVLKGVVSRLARFPQVFETWQHGWQYARTMLASGGGDHQPREIHVRLLNRRALWCRPDTSDPWVLWDVFATQYQRVPADVPVPRQIVDLGANVGYTTAYYAASYPDARVLAVEMDEANWRLACRNNSGDRCQVVHAAVWDADGSIEYGGTEDRGFRVTALDRGTRGRRVASRSLDSLFHEHGLSRVDFLKMDIEGAEATVFAGSLQWLKGVQALKIELHPPMTYTECAQILTGEG